MLTKFNAVEAYERTIDKLIEWEERTPPIIQKTSMDHYEHLKSMSEYLADSLELGAEEVLLNIAEVNSLVKKIN